ncbi:S49 family peptidase [Acidiferrobacter thiooxydans]|jgi:protease-4|uniref:S49 family peptidase n=1 Tax=Acidiferrobacter thiooxydans TaxID=163359 RepID=A0A1C2G2K2_9GAMM|nr:S49 family peptidase [Acidiferrobacter thiooxydans]MDA8189888.1 S49 family peptidase [Gammaproteobacteria bacterium]RCN56241.1 S49 family peptidase [Acidiferrobacter thiooxydans]UEN98476.1 S49 family peptidase [Acidiferrobacter thiooxydans]
MSDNNDAKHDGGRDGRSDRDDRSGLSEDWARATLEKLAFAALHEQRRSRRWTLAFRFLVITLIVALFLSYEGAQMRATGLAGRFTALVRMDGTIQEGGPASARPIDAALRHAFAAHPAGVILDVDSPGGSPVQASDINAEIWRLRGRYPHTPVYAVVQDLCASGCYYVAVATDRIYANPASLVGSVGVLMDGFGYTRLMHKIGVTRRLLVAGANKDFLDPFSPLTKAHKAFAEKMLAQIHAQFIQAVKKGRGARLRPHPGLFSGLIWTGYRARQLGLIDGFGTVGQVARHLFNAPRIVDFSPKEGLVTRFAQHLGATMSQTFVAQWLSPLPHVQ